MTSMNFKLLSKRTANHGLFLCFCIIFVCLGTSLLNAMIRDISLDELVEKADVIAIVNVIAIKDVGNLPSGAKLIANLVKVDQPLKGGTAIGENLKLKTRGIEDNAVLKKGMKTLLFLKKIDNYYEVVAGKAGSWPINSDGQLVGYGTGKKLSDVEKAIDDFENKKKQNKDSTTNPKVSSETYKFSI